MITRINMDDLKYKQYRIDMFGTENTPNMIDITVFDRELKLGVFTVPEPKVEDVMIIFEEIQFKNNCGIDVLYIPDLKYGITITDKICKTINNK